MRSLCGKKTYLFAVARLLSAALLVTVCTAPCMAVDVTFTVSANSDDADERVSDGYMWVGDTYSWIDNHAGARFQNVTIPQGATITSATLELFSYGSGTTSFSVDIAAEDADTTSTFSTSNYNISSRTKTSAQTAWVTGSTSYSDYQSFTSPNFATSIQEVVNRTGWSSGNSLTVILTPVSGGKGFWKRAGSSTHAPRLHISYTTEPIGTLLFVRDGTSYTASEQLRVTQFESWGYTVTPIEDSESQANYDAALASADVVFVNEEVASSSVSYKLRETTVGVVFDEAALVDEFGMSSTYGNPGTHTSLTVIDNTHYIMSPFATGSLSVASPAASIHSLAGTLAPDLQVLGDWTSSSGVAVVEKGGTLYNTYNSSDVAFGRRVAIPVQSTFDWSGLTSDGLTIFQRALEWAADFDGLVGYWKLDETSGTTAEDSSGSGNDGTYTNSPTLGADSLHGYGTEFDGVDDHVDLGTLNDDFSEGVTISVWAKPTGVKHWARFVELGDGSSNHNIILGRQNTTDTLSVVLHDGSLLSGQSQLAATDSIQLNRWQHFVATIDSSGEATLYKNGQVIATGTIGFPSDATRSQCYIGRSNWGTDDYYEGGMAEVRVYNRAISASEVVELYGLVGHWKFDETSGTTAADSSGSGNDGTYVNSPTLGATGLRGYAAQLNASDTDDRIDLPAETINGTAAVSAAWWMKTDYTGYTSVISGANSGQFNEFSLAFTTDTNFRPHVRGTTQNYTIDSIADGKWKHYCYLHNQRTGVEQLYINGELVVDATRSSSSQTIDIDDGGLLLGQEQDSLGGGFSSSQIVDGTIDDFVLYNRMMTEEEVLKHYGLTGHWRLDETSGTTAADSSGLGNDGTYVDSPDLAQTALRSYGVEMNATGSGDYIDLPNQVLDGATAVSVSWWLKTDYDGYKSILSGANASDDNNLLISLTDLSNLRTLYGTGSGTSYAIDSISDGQWRHFCYRHDRITGVEQLYIDGELAVDVTRTPDSTPLDIDDGGLLIGQEQDSVGGGFSSTQALYGTLDDIRIYNRMVTDIEIAEHYGLVGHWNFDEGSGTDIADTTVFGNDAGFNTGSPAWVDGIYGSALEFDGTSDAATTANFDPPETGAVAFWMRSDGPPASRHRPWGVGADFEMWQDTDGLVSMDLNSDGYQGGFITTEPLYRTDVWYHVVAQFDASDDSYEIYIDGDLHKSGISTRDIQKQAANLLTFGTRTGNTQRFTGALDDFRVYNRWLPVSEINDLYGRVAYWKLDEFSGSVAADSTDHGHDGTLVSGPQWTAAGNVDGALDFESSDAERIDAGTFDVSGSEMTLMAWVKAEGGVHDGRIVFKSSSNTGADQSWGLTVADSLEPEFRLRAGGSLGRLITPGVVSTGRWYHLTGTYDGTTMRLYINGLEADMLTHPAGGAIDEDSSKYVTLGDSPIGGRAFDGMMDDVQIFDRALDPSEVFNAYKGGRPTGVRILRWVEAR